MFAALMLTRKKVQSLGKHQQRQEMQKHKLDEEDSLKSTIYHKNFRL
jgi:hypothetical protein